MLAYKPRFAAIAELSLQRQYDAPAIWVNRWLVDSEHRADEARWLRHDLAVQRCADRAQPLVIHRIPLPLRVVHVAPCGEEVVIHRAPHTTCNGVFDLS